MRHRLANLSLLSALGGCSLIYNPNNIPEGRVDGAVDAPPDAEIVVDADPSMLMLSSVSPDVLTEGAGDGGSRYAVLVVNGMHLTETGLTVALVPVAGTLKTPRILLQTQMMQIDANGRRLAIPLALPVDPDLAAGETIVFDVTVSQTAAGGAVVTQTLPGALTLRGLDELDGPAPAMGFVENAEYSKINITMGTVKSMSANAPLQLRSTSSITIAPAATVAFNAAGSTGGPGGFNGGAGGVADALNPGLGARGAGPAGGAPMGGDAGWSGDAQLTTFGEPNRGSGGGGGMGGGLLQPSGGAGGGGGGAVQLVAAGDLTVGNISARGVAGAGGQQQGGGGSGGVILLRAGGALTAGTLDVTGFPTPGRVRYDAGGTATVMNAASHHRGPMVETAPLITTDETPQLTVTGQPLSTFSYYVTSEDGAGVRGPVGHTVPANGVTTFSMTEALFPGLNTVCLIVADAALTSDTRNCVSIAHLYRPAM